MNFFFFFNTESILRQTCPVSSVTSNYLFIYLFIYLFSLFVFVPYSENIESISYLQHSPLQVYILLGLMTFLREIKMQISLIM